MKLFYLAVLCLMLSIMQLCAVTLSATGFGDSPEQAKANALNELSSRIYVKVQSTLIDINSEESYNIKQHSYAKIFKEITLESNLPIMGAEYSAPIKQHGQYSITTSLNSETALPLYEAKQKDLIKEMQIAKTAISGTQSTEVSYQQLLAAKALLESYTIINLIYTALGGKLEQEAPFTENEISNAIAKLQQAYDDLQFALKSAAHSFSTFKNVYPYYSSVYPSDEVTQFSRLVQSTLANLVNSVSEPQKANYYLTSSYEIMADKLVLNLRLIDKNGSLKAGSVLNLNPPAYRNTDYLPKSLDIAKAITMKELITSDLSIELSTLQGKNILLYTAGQEVKLMVKANQPCQFYIASHVHQADDKVYSYLLELYPNAANDARFIYNIPAENCNRWIMLSDFVAKEPFGVEILHIIATTGEIEKMIPSTKIDKETGLYKLSDKPREAIVAMRGLTPKAKGTETAESNLTLTVMKE